MALTFRSAGTHQVHGRAVCGAPRPQVLHVKKSLQRRAHWPHLVRVELVLEAVAAAVGGLWQHLQRQ